MPWCSDCDRFYTQSTLNNDGTCPQGHQAAPIPPPNARAGAVDDPAAEAAADSKSAPWHFWLMVIALTIYLGWRLVQGIMWAIGKL